MGDNDAQMRKYARLPHTKSSLPYPSVRPTWHLQMRLARPKLPPTASTPRSYFSPMMFILSAERMIRRVVGALHRGNQEACSDLQTNCLSLFLCLTLYWTCVGVRVVCVTESAVQINSGCALHIPSLPGAIPRRCPLRVCDDM